VRRCGVQRAGGPCPTPRYDERFRGYGLNKVSHLYACAAAGLRFTVLPGVFVVAGQHPKSAAWAATFGQQAAVQQRMLIAALFRRFKQELLEGQRQQQRALPHEAEAACSAGAGVLLDPAAVLDAIERGAAVAAARRGSGRGGVIIGGGGGGGFFGVAPYNSGRGIHDSGISGSDDDDVRLRTLAYLPGAPCRARSEEGRLRRTDRRNGVE